MDEIKKLYLFGPPQLLLNDREVTLGRRHSMALMAYLAIESGPHAREEIATVLWPGVSREQARTSLRSTLPLVYKYLGREALIADRKTITLTSDTGLWVDVSQFQTVVATILRHHPETAEPLCADCASRFQSAITLYRGEFMAGFSFPDRPDYTRWQVYWQQNLLRQLGTVMTRLSQYELAQQDQEKALATLRRWLGIDPYNEGAHRQLMLLYQEMGQRPLAIQHYQTLVETLQSDLNISTEAETSALYETIRGPLRTTCPAPHSLPHKNSPPHNLPPPLNRFLGRETEISEISERLDKPECRLLTISGPGGIGKSRLAIEIGRLFLPLCADGVYFVPLAPIEEPDLIIPTIADALNFSFYSQEDMGQQLTNFLREKAILLILDNFEHLMNGKLFLLDMLKTAQHIKVLITSRESLNLQAEWLYDLDGLPYPTLGDDDSAQPFTAVQLFVERAQQAYKHFSLTAETQPCIHEMCRFVAGTPLAIELLAPLVKIQTCQQIVRELRHDTDILATTRQDIPVRHRSIRAVFEQSWQLLSTSERMVLKKLSIFRGSFDVVAAADITGTVSSILESLLNKSLIRQPKSGRFELHELIKQYAQEYLSMNEAKTLADLHSRYFADFLAKRACVLQSGTQPIGQVVPEVSQEIENIRAAWHWAISREQAPILTQMMEPLSYFYRSRGWLTEGYETFSVATERLKAQSENTNLSSAARRELLGSLIAYQAWFSWKLSKYNLAERLTDEALSIMEQVGDKQHLAFLWFIKGNIGIYDRRNSPETQDLFRQSYELYQELNHTPGMVDCLNNLAITYSNNGDFKAAKVLYQQAIAICEREGYLELYARIINNLGVVYDGLGQYQDALHAYKSCFDVCQQMQNKTGMAVSLINQGEVALKTGHYQKAKDFCQRQIPIMRDIGDRYFIVAGLVSLGHAQYMLAEYTDAWHTLSEGLQIALAIESTPVIAQVFGQLARLLYHLQRFESSFALLTASECHITFATHNSGAPKNLHELLVDKIPKEKRLEIQNTWREREHHEVALFVQYEYQEWCNQGLEERPFINSHNTLSHQEPLSRPFT